MSDQAEVLLGVEALLRNPGHPDIYSQRHICSRVFNCLGRASEKGGKVME